MKKLLSLLIVLTAIGTLLARQTPLQPDPAASLSDERYDELLGRLTALDSTLTPAECAELYYGFATRPEYTGSKGYGEDEVHKLVEQQKYEKVFEQARKILEKCPVSLQAYEQILFSGFKLGYSPEQMLPYNFRFGKLLSGIFTSGIGLTKETAVRVLAVRDEYVLMRMAFGAQQILGQSLEDMRYDVIKIDTSAVYPGKTIYFDVTLPMNQTRKAIGAPAL